MLGFEFKQMLYVNHIREGAAGFRFGKQNDLARRKNFRRFSHERDAAENDSLAIHAGRDAAQLQGIARIVRDILDLGNLVVVRKNHGVARRFQFIDSFYYAFAHIIPRFSQTVKLSYRTNIIMTERKKQSKNKLTVFGQEVKVGGKTRFALLYGGNSVGLIHKNNLRLEGLHLRFIYHAVRDDDYPVALADEARRRAIEAYLARRSRSRYHIGFEP
jgi:hypothetical protein